MKSKFICISGKAQNGKDTSASLLEQRLTKQGYKVIITHYGDLVKYICTKFFNWDGNKDEKGRTLLQFVGTDVVRKQDADFWVKFVVDIVTLFDGLWDYVIVPDARFPNELEYIKNAGFDMFHVRVIRENFVSPLTAEQQAHASETSLDNYEYDYLITNNSMDNLKNNIDTLFNKITKVS